MRCLICDSLLTDEESVRKYKPTSVLKDNFVDTCNPCLDIIRDIERDFAEQKKEGSIKPLKHSKYY